MRDQPGGAGDRQCAGECDRAAFRSSAVHAGPHLRRPASAMTNSRPTGAVTIVTQTRVCEDGTDAFAKFQATISAAVAEQPGFIEQSVLPPDPPTQVDWVILQR